MEVDLVCRMVFPSHAQAALAEAVLSGCADAPLFESEVEPGLRPLFASIDGVESAREATIDEADGSLVARWQLGSHHEAGEVLRSLEAVHVDRLAALIVEDVGSVRASVLIGGKALVVREVTGTPIGSALKRASAEELLRRLLLESSAE